MHRLLATLLVAFALTALAATTLVAPVAAAQDERSAGGNREDDGSQLYAYTLKHRSAEDAEAVIRPLLSPGGRLFLRPGSNTVVVRDSLAAISRIMPVLRRFDRSIDSVEVEVMIVRARRSAFSPVIIEDELPQPLLEQLKKLLPYSSYKVLAATELAAQPGDAVTYELGEGFAVSFRLGAVSDQRVRLDDFRVLRTGAGEARKQLLRSTLRLPLARPWALGLTPTEAASTALIVVLTPRRVGVGEEE